MDELTAAQSAIVRQVLDTAPPRPDSLLPVLHALQERLGYIPVAAFANIGSALQCSRAEVHGVVSFYHDFRTAPPPAHRVRLCRAEACQAMGAQRLHQVLTQALAALPPAGATTVALEDVYCLGNCACAPALTVDGALHGRVTDETCRALLQALGSPS